METGFDGKALGKELALLPHWKVAVFGLLVCERMLPGFEIFAQRTGHAGTEVLRASLARAWKLLEDDTATTFDLRFEVAACDAVIPDTEATSDRYASAAVDAVCAVSLLLEAMTRPELSVAKIVDIAALARDTIHLIVPIKENWSSSDVDLTARIASHPMMQAELRCQRETLDLLTRVAADRITAMSSLEVRWRTSTNIIGLPL